ncbi:hypothetical protein SB2_25570 [Methylobacterium radiotolerans]|nr:hypothetical protein SB3_28295 [Methylobacterium radiotolerans]KTS44105.1 hypothetical protein SB2_25570 [Methylobacterium radiotolerans]
MPWTRFMDMHSGGSQKEAFAYLYIEAPEAEAKIIFYNRFGHNPDRVTCTCCGSDYSIDEEKSLESGTGYERGCAFDKESDDYVDQPDTESRYSRKYIPLDEYLAQADVAVIRADEIKPEERVGSLPRQGYVWCD